MIKFNKLPFNLSQVYLTSDTHYNHKNIVRGVTTWDRLTLEEDCRKFETVEEMNGLLINNINEVVGENDLLIHCGDFSFQGEQSIYEFRGAISCKNVILIQGNHDYLFDSKPELKDLFYDFTQIGHYEIEGINIVCCHYPLIHWNKSHKGTYHFHGHLHGFESDILELIHNNLKSKDVGVDTNNFYPYNLEKLIEKWSE